LVDLGSPVKDFQSTCKNWELYFDVCGCEELVGLLTAEFFQYFSSTIQKIVTYFAFN